MGTWSVRVEDRLEDDIEGVECVTGLTEAEAADTADDYRGLYKGCKIIVTNHAKPQETEAPITTFGDRVDRPEPKGPDDIESQIRALTMTALDDITEGRAPSAYRNLVQAASMVRRLQRPDINAVREDK